MATTFKAKLREKKPLLGTLLTLPSPEIAEVFVDAGFDWLLIDMEHGLLTYADTQRIIQAVGPSRPCLVRVPTNDSASVAKALDTGAAGLVFPHIIGVEQARAAIRAAKYPPKGTRSIGVARSQGYGSYVKESIEWANRELVLIAQAEHIEAAKGIEALIAVPGIDGIFIGLFDLSASLNKPGEITDPEVEAAVKTIRDACSLAHLPLGILARNADAARDRIREGFRLICIASETMLLGDMARQAVQALRYALT
jgi:2-dehydro-3-deoxyglucarate aldolase/4-hydroxy-2-oxoheptanedioate aldolase